VLLQRYKHYKEETNYLSDIKRKLLYEVNERIKDSRYSGDSTNPSPRAQDDKSNAMQAVDHILQHRKRALHELHRCSQLKYEQYRLKSPASTTSTNYALVNIPVWTPLVSTANSEGPKYSPASPASSCCMTWSV
jgi:hypothetical protein